MKSLIDNYTKEELKYIVDNSFSMKEVISKLGYKTSSGSNNNTVRERIIKDNISTAHFIFKKGTVRNDNNVFCNNSTASQATLRRWFKKISDDSRCQICGQNKIWNNKELIMILDHINGRNHDNQIENLRWICPNCNSQLSTFAGKNNTAHDGYTPVKIRKRTYKICPICNINEIKKSSNMCCDCRKELNHKKQEEKILNHQMPSKEELETLIYKYSFVKIGKQFNVSDQTVRKWCKQYGLPFKHGDLHKYVS